MRDPSDERQLIVVPDVTFDLFILVILGTTLSSLGHTGM